MMRHVLSLSLLLCAMSVSVVSAQPSAEVCNSSGGPTICVRFDNLSVAPSITVDFDLTFDGSEIPSVNLLLGDNGTTTYEWRVWSKDGSGNPAAINVIQGVGAEDYKVRILNPANGPGATTVTTINLDPSNAANYSRILAGNMTGNLSGNLTLQKASGGTGGDSTMTIGGNAAGALTVPEVTAMTITGTLSGTLTTSAVSTSLTIGKITGGAGTSVTINGDVNGNITAQEMEGSSGNKAEIVITGDLKAGDTLRVNDFDVYSDLHIQDDCEGTIIVNDLTAGTHGTIFPSSSTLIIDGELASTGFVNVQGGLAGTIEVKDAGAGIIGILIPQAYPWESTGVLEVGDDPSDIFSGSLIVGDVDPQSDFDVAFNGRISIGNYEKLKPHQ